ncbi:MAG: Fe(3+) dicitrate transport ATP-binding protein [Pseudomonadota bacterium]|jgi:iron complex transport system ATP-binding protein
MTQLSVRALEVVGRLSPIDLDLEPGRVHLIVGPNGAGKTTLLRALVGLLPEARGEVRHGDRVLGPGAHRRADVLGWLPQTSPIEAGLTASEVVATARFRFQEPLAAATAAARTALGSVGLAHCAGERVDRLSGGERQRVRLAALIAQATPWWLLDEPSNHLDPKVQLAVLDEIDRHAATGGVLLVTHDLLPIARWPTARVLGFEAGRCVLDARADDRSLPDGLSRLFGVAMRREPGGAVVVDAGRR